MPYCPKCGNTGRKLDGSPCECVTPTDTLYADLVGMDLPEQYQGVRFSGALVPTDCGPSYAPLLEKWHTAITTLQAESHNLCICSPPNHSKTVWAYSCLQNLFRQRVPVVPLYDVLEIRRKMMDYDMGRSDEESLYTVPYLFVRIPAEVNYLVRTTIATILDRRVRQGHTTIFLYNGTWGTLTYGDDTGVISGLQGDGSFTSLDVYSYSKQR